MARPAEAFSAHPQGDRAPRASVIRRTIPAGPLDDSSLRMHSHCAPPDPRAKTPHIQKRKTCASNFGAGAELHERNMARNRAPASSGTPGKGQKPSPTSSKCKKPLATHQNLRPTRASTSTCVGTHQAALSHMRGSPVVRVPHTQRPKSNHNASAKPQRTAMSSTPELPRRSSSGCPSPPPTRWPLCSHRTQWQDRCTRPCPTTPRDPRRARRPLPPPTS